MNNPAWTFQDRLRKAREHAGMTQSELAETTGISLNSLNRYEKGQRSPGDEIVRSIATATGVALEWFYADSEDPAASSNALHAKLTVEWTPNGIQVASAGK